MGTSNVGSRSILKLADNGNSLAQNSPDYQAMRAAVKQELGQRFRPEFLNRLDEIIVFSSLDQHQVDQVAGIMLQQLVRRCAENDMQVAFTSQVKKAIVTSGFSPTYGARPLRRAVQRLCEDAIAEAFLDSFISSGESFTVDADEAGSVLLKNCKGAIRKHEQQPGQGIEDEAGPGIMPSSGGILPSRPDMSVRVTSPRT